MAKAGECLLSARTCMTSLIPICPQRWVGLEVPLLSEKATYPRSHEASGPSLNGHTLGPALRSGSPRPALTLAGQKPDVLWAGSNVAKEIQGERRRSSYRCVQDILL